MTRAVQGGNGTFFTGHRGPCDAARVGAMHRAAQAKLDLVEEAVHSDWSDLGSLVEALQAILEEDP